MAWDSSLEIGIEHIDRQHEQLVEKIEEFLEAHTQKKGQSVINSLLNFLEDYVVKHFSDEEALQQSSNYPKYGSHMALHKYFIEDFIDLKAQIDEEGESANMLDNAKEVLLDWIISHVSGEDMEFGMFYNSVYPKP